MKFFALVASGDKIELTENEFKRTKTRLQRNINRNLSLDNGGLILAGQIVYLGTDQKKAK